MSDWDIEGRTGLITGRTGLCLVDRKPVRPPRFAEGAENRNKLWSLSAGMTGVVYDLKNIEPGMKNSE